MSEAGALCRNPALRGLRRSQDVDPAKREGVLCRNLSRRAVDPALHELRRLGSLQLFSHGSWPSRIANKDAVCHAVTDSHAISQISVHLQHYPSKSSRLATIFFKFLSPNSKFLLQSVSPSYSVALDFGVGFAFPYPRFFSVQTPCLRVSVVFICFWLRPCCAAPISG